MVATARKAIDRLTNRQPESAPDLAARWVRESVELREDADPGALLVARVDAWLAAGDELSLLEAILPDTHRRAEAVARLSDPALEPMTDAVDVQLMRAMLAAPVDITFKMRNQATPWHIVEEVRMADTFNVAAHAGHIVRLRDLYRARRREAADHQQAHDAAAPAYEAAVGRVRAELQRVGLWDRLVIGDPSAEYYLTTPHFFSWLSQYRPVPGGWAQVGARDRLLSEAKAQGAGRA